MESGGALQLGPIEGSFDTRYSAGAREVLDELPESFTITDPGIPGHPIVFASVGFAKMSGYSKEEVLGRNGRVFQGPGTCRRSVAEIREAIREERGVEVCILNYRKDGSPFWMLFSMCPVFSRDDGRVVHFVGVQVPIGGRKGCSEVLFGSCRREISSGSVCSKEVSLVVGLGTKCVRGPEIEEYCQASDVEKQRASATINSILSVLVHYSELTGRLVSGKRCILIGMGALSSSVNISLRRIKQSFVLTDPHLPDMPIVYASDAFLRMTGYARHEVIGRNCRFLSGPDTNSSIQHQIRETIHSEQACTVRILNYRKDKSSFWNLLHISPVRNATGKIAYFVGVQIEEHEFHGRQGLSPETRQLSVVGAVKVAVRSISIAAAATAASSSR
uniref:Putative LOV domain-containing protein n=1 Tax=Hypericum perforatum TaxID=65561 RepID=A0A126WWR4_HYPPE|nr:putative LOV domain-containing protein [Hypericum perforatum]